MCDSILLLRLLRTKLALALLGFAWRGRASLIGAPLCLRSAATNAPKLFRSETTGSAIRLVTDLKIRIE